jgi:rhodanese-related sulfurtransferase
MDKTDDLEINEQSATSKTLLTGILIFTSIIILGLIFMPKPKKTYKISENQMLEQLVAQYGIAGPELVTDMIYQPNEKYQFIDLRNSPDFQLGHLPNAINIPVKHIFDKEYEAILNPGDKINVLYAADHAAACGPWMILRQLGYNNNLIMLGSYDYVKNNIIEDFAPMSGNFRDEKPKFDFAKIISETSGGKVSSGTETNNPGIIPAVKKKKEPKSGGGC